MPNDYLCAISKDLNSFGKEDFQWFALNLQCPNNFQLLFHWSVIISLSSYNYS